MTPLRWLRSHVPAEARPALGAIHRLLDEHLTTDRWFIEREYKRVFGRPPDLVHPRTFNEKIQWRKLYDRQPIHKTMTDKIAVRDYVASRVGERYLVPSLGVYERPEEVPWEELPAPYVVKASPGCGWNLFVHDPAEADFSEMNRTLRGWLKTDFYRHAREWAYKDVPRRILIERFIGIERRPFDDFKFFCFDGVPQVGYRLVDRYGNYTQTWYDANWMPLPFHGKRPAAAPTPAPPALPEMLDVARRLSDGVDFVRVDLYHIDGRVYCGEMTLYPCGGFEVYSTPDADAWLGAFWNLQTSTRTP